MRAATLLARATALVDGSELGAQARAAARGGFASGGAWMARASALVRGANDDGHAARPPYARLGCAKYALALGAALVVALAAAALGAPYLAPLAVPAFYAVEAQMVFLFPLAADGSRRPFRDARAATVRAGGTLAVMRVVMPIAVAMVFGGVIGRGFLRSWCIGCAAVVLWYEALRAGAREAPAREGGLERGG